MTMQNTNSTRTRRRGGPMGGRGRGPMGHGGPMAMMKGEKPRDFKGTMNKLIQYLGPYHGLDPARADLRHRLHGLHPSSAPRSWAMPPPSCSKA